MVHHRAIQICNINNVKVLSHYASHLSVGVRSGPLNGKVCRVHSLHSLQATEQQEPRPKMFCQDTLCGTQNCVPVWRACHCIGYINIGYRLICFYQCVYIRYNRYKCTDINVLNIPKYFNISVFISADLCIIKLKNN